MEKRIQDPVTVQLYAMANGRKSEYHNFVYTPKEGSYSAMPSYSLQSHVAEGNYRSPHAEGHVRGSPDHRAGSVAVSLDRSRNFIFNHIQRPQDCPAISRHSVPSLGVTSDSVAALEPWPLP